MLLHKNIDAFNYLITKTAEYFGFNESVIEKDYYVSLLLKELVKINPNLIFKGGTSLSKCFGIINRFSEDIDVSMLSTSIGNRRQIKTNIISVCKNLDLKISNESSILSHRKFNRYIIQYPRNHKDISVYSSILLETAFITKSYPIIHVSASNYIYDYLKSLNKLEYIDKYHLEPFQVKSQTLERTFIDKIYAICDYYLKKVITRNSRHLYDLYFLYNHIKINDDFKNLVNEVHKERYIIKSCLSAKDGCDVNEILKEIIDSNYFKQDYLLLTSKIVLTPLKYEEAVKIIEKIRQLNLF